MTIVLAFATRHGMVTVSGQSRSDIDKRETTMLQIQYGDHSVDFDALPEASKKALASRGLTHFLGNEQAAKLTNWAATRVAKAIKELGEAPAKSDVDAATEMATPNDAERATRKIELVAEALKTLHDGTVGVRVGGPKADPIESIMSRLASVEVADVLRANKAKMPKGDETVVIGGQSLTKAELIARRIAKHGDRLRKAAQKELADKAKATKDVPLDELV